MVKSKINWKKAENVIKRGKAIEKRIIARINKIKKVYGKTARARELIREELRILAKSIGNPYNRYDYFDLVTQKTRRPKKRLIKHKPVKTRKKPVYVSFKTKDGKIVKVRANQIVKKS